MTAANATTRPKVGDSSIFFIFGLSSTEAVHGKMC
jgi:hypothetical protein